MKRSAMPARSKPIRKVSESRRRDAAAHRAWRDRVFARDGGVCLAAVVFPEISCAGQRDPHHVAATGKYPELRFDPSNGATVCRRHHDVIHQEQPARARLAGLLR